MCGILGYCSTSAHHDAWIEKAIRLLAHRGPDNHGMTKSPSSFVGFAHTRLAIVDLSPAGNQPMLSPCGRFMISFNGEIYNHNELRDQLNKIGYSFNTRSDTETLLTCFIEWGTGCFEKLKGMFSIALFDNCLKKLYLVRDIAGEKPLYFHVKPGNQDIFFSSELKPLLFGDHACKTLSNSQLFRYLMYGYTSQSSTLVDECQKLPPAHFLEYSLESLELKIKSYWSPPNSILSKPYSFHQLSTEFESVFFRSVQSQLQADVPSAILLSGGLDSSLITAIAARVSDTEVSTFNVSFNSDTYDERHYADYISKYFGTSHTCIKIDESSVNSLQFILDNIDEPISDSSLLPTFLVCKEVSNHFKVALGGDGSDELFGGYKHYNTLMYASIFRNFSNSSIKKSVNSMLTILPTGTKGKNLLSSLFYERTNKNQPLFPPTFFSLYDIQQLLGLDSSFSLLESIVDCFDSIGSLDQKSNIVNATHFDFHDYLPGDVLAKVDKMSMLNSLEMRSPFLDKEVINFAFTCLQPYQKVSYSKRKIFLKKFAQKYLPDNFDFRRKQGFSIPINQWIKQRGPFRDFFYDTLLNSDSFFSRKYILRLLDDQEKYGKSNSHRLFCLLSLIRWYSSNQMTVNFT